MANAIRANKIPPHVVAAGKAGAAGPGKPKIHGPMDFSTKALRAEQEAGKKD